MFNIYNQAKLSDDTKRNDIAKSMGYNSFGQLEKAYNDALAYNKYRKLAGEIEAWDVEERLDMTAEQRKNTRPDIDRTDVVFADGGVSYSIVENFIDEKGNKYENAVLLDTDFFDGVSPRNWGRKLQIYVENRSINNPVIMPIFDESGNKQVLAFAKINDRVRNNRVINELYRTSDNISKISVIHIDEIAEVSKENNPYYSKTNSHEWLDKNGWLHRNANVINKKNGAIYNLTLDIAKSKDGRTILYTTKGKIKKVGNVAVNSLKLRGSQQKSDFKDSISNHTENVNNNLKESARDTEYLELAKNPEQNREKLQRMLDKVARENGYPVEAYHGTARADRVGYVFLPERATSGAIYAISRSNEPTTNNNFDEKLIAEYITTLEDKEYDNKQVLERLLKAVSKNVGRVLGRYSSRSNRFVGYGRKVSQSGRNTQNESDRTGISGTDSQSVKYHDRNPETMKQLEKVNLCHFVVLCNMCKSNVKYLYINILYNLCLKIHILHIFGFIKVKY